MNYPAFCEEVIRQTFGNAAQMTSCQIITDGYRNLTASVSCNAYPAPLFFKAEKPFLYPRTQKHQIAREKMGLMLCAQHDIPAPTLIAAGDEPSAWLLESFLPGKTLSVFSLTDENRITIGNEFEALFHKLCQIQSDRYGDTFDGGFIGKHKTWKTALSAMTELVYEDGEALGLWNGHTSLIQSALQKALGQTADDSAPVFYHCDLFSANVMGQADENGHVHIHSIIDFGMSLFAPLQYVRNMTGRYCDLLYSSHHSKESFENETAYRILRIEPLLLMKLFQYPDAEAAVERHVEACVSFLNKQ